MRALKPTRVCFLIDELGTGGTESQLLALLQQVDRRRVIPYLVLLRGERQRSRVMEPAGIPILRLDIPSLRSVRAVRKALTFAQFLWRERIDIVQVYFADSSYFGVPVAWLAGVPCRIRTRNNIGHWVTWADRILGRALNSLTTATVANCRAAKEALLLHERPRPSSVRVLENGVDIDRFLVIPPPTNRARSVGMVAMLRTVKGIDGLVRAAQQLRRDHPHLEFTVAGEGPERERLEHQIRQGGLEGAFHLPGVRTDIPAFLAGLDLAVLASHSEGMPNAVLEYMAAARPIVATAVGATPDLIRDGQEGLLIPAGDENALARAMNRLLTDRTLARTLGMNARRRAVEHFGRPAMVRRFENFYMELMRHREGQPCPT